MSFDEDIIKCLGGFPKKTALDLKIVNEEDKDGYTLATVEYNLEENQRTRAYLLVPDKSRDRSTLPGILAIHQHNGQWHLGKSEVVGLDGDNMYSYGLDLCRRGYVVLAPDLLCFESRVDDAFSMSRDMHSRYESFEFCRHVSNGSCLQTKYLHDLSVAVDVLDSLDIVDSNRIGAIGHSMGGQEATWITWHDKRIKVGVSSCGISQVKAIFRDKITHNYAMFVPGMSKYGDMSDIVSSIAPRAFMMTNGIGDDIFPLDGVYDIAAQAKITYSNANCINSFESIVFDGEHSFPDDVKLSAYAFIDRFLHTH